LNGATPLKLGGVITYESSLTPLLQSISPRFGSVVGGEVITFNGVNFSTDKDAYTVLLDNRVCTVEEATATYFKCRTSPRPGLFPNPTTEIRIAGMGRVAT
jgi:IPT/TIG domain